MAVQNAATFCFLPKHIMMPTILLFACWIDCAVQCTHPLSTCRPAGVIKAGIICALPRKCMIERCCAAGSDYVLFEGDYVYAALHTLYR